uniref:Aminopeptidase N-like N-terminal domain-containing protein n=1 Tax=Megaselia scalaris TaxID=36166 RepID=T1GAS1_MEGSC
MEIVVLRIRVLPAPIRVFPCFDEPQLKATFQVNIVRPKEYNSFSNTRLVSTTDEGILFISTIYISNF